MSIREVSPELKNKAKLELGEEDGRIEQDLRIIKEWIGKQAHLKARLDDQWLVAFLRGCKFSLEKTKEKLDTFYALRSAIPEVCANLDPTSKQTKDLLKTGFFVILPKVIPKTGECVAIVKPGAYDATKINVLDTVRINYMISMIQMMEDDNVVISGQRFIVDLDGVNMHHLAQMTPVNVKKMVKVGQDGLPIRQKGTHHINVPAGSDTVFSLFKLFMNEKNSRRLFVHSNTNDLYDFIPKEILPTEYGGNAGSIEDMINFWIEKFESYKDWFLEDSQYKTDESKRTGTPKTPESLFGIEGSFRKLNVD